MTHFTFDPSGNLKIKNDESFFEGFTEYDDDVEIDDEDEDKNLWN